MLDPTHAEKIVAALTDELRTGSDRHISILGAAFVEFALDWAISSRLAERPDLHARVFKSSRKKWNFSTKIDVAALLNVYNPEDEKDANTIREIRNHFAHDLFGDLTEQTPSELTFDTHAIAKQLGSLDCLRLLGALNPPAEFGFDCTTNAGRFRFAIWYIVTKTLASAGAPRQ